jgi:glycosyltransferase involved in cell wall biosynthesis
VSDYTRRLAVELVRQGDEVSVISSGASGWSMEDGVHVGRVADDAGWFRREDAPGMASTRPPTVLVQYTPHSFGWRSLNLGFCLRLAWRGLVRGDDVRIMFHEVAFPFVRWPAHHNLLALGHRLMAGILLASARRCHVSTTAWLPLLRWFNVRGRSVTSLPIPSNIEPLKDGEKAGPDGASSRPDEQGREAGALRLVHFSTFGPTITRLLKPALEKLLEEPKLHVALLGRGARRFADTFSEAERTRLTVAEDLPEAELSRHLAEADIALQPYPDGVTTRRTTVMACLAHGLPTVTNRGPLTEEDWDDVVALASSPAPEVLAGRVRELLNDPEARRTLGRHGRERYRREWSLERTVQRLRSDP